MREVWIQYTYGYDGIESIEGVWATVDAAIGKWRAVWKRVDENHYLLQGSNDNTGEALRKFTVQEEH
jgi:hypothetical protein